MPRPTSPHRLLLFSCLTILGAPIQLVAQGVPWSCADVLRIDSGRLFRVSAAHLDSEGVLWIANSGSGEVLAFSGDGKLLRVLGGQGDGPGEFRALSNLSVFGDSVVVSDMRNGRITTFDRGGIVVDTWNLAGSRWVGSEFSTISRDSRVFTFRNWSDEQTTEGFLQYDAQLSEGGEQTQPRLIHSLPGLEEFLRARGQRVLSWPIPFGRKALAAGSSQWIVLGWNGFAEVVRFSFATGEQEIIRLPTKGRKVDSSLLEAEKRRVLGLQVDEAVGSDAQSVFAAMEIRDTAPEYSTINVSEDGSVWVGDWISPIQEDRPYTVLDSEGPLGHLSLPGSSQVLQVSGDRAIILDKGPLGEEVVRVATCGPR